MRCAQGISDRHVKGNTESYILICQGGLLTAWHNHEADLVAFSTSTSTI